MKPKFKWIVLSALFVLMPYVSKSQQTVQMVDSTTIASIKKDVWIPFMQSYHHLDIDKFRSIYTPDVIRISIDLNKIEVGQDYFASIESFFETIEKRKLQMTIKFSVLSTAISDTIAYQEGYYSIGIRSNNQEAFKFSGYSRFSVMLQKKEDIWKISIDSDKRTQITEDEFVSSGALYSINHP